MKKVVKFNMKITTLTNLNEEPSDAELKMIMAEVAIEAKIKYLASKKKQEKLIEEEIEKLNKSRKG